MEEAEQRRKKRRADDWQEEGVHRSPGWSCSEGSDNDTCNRQGADQSYNEDLHLEPDPEANRHSAANS